MSWIDLSGAFALEDMVNLAHKHGTKTVVKGMNPVVRRILTELSVIKSPDSFQDGVCSLF